MNSNRQQSIGLAWFSNEVYDEARMGMDDGHRLPTTFEIWEQTALRREQQLREQGCDTVRAYIHPDVFREYCSINALAPDTVARHQYAASVAQGRDLERDDPTALDAAWLENRTHSMPPPPQAVERAQIHHRRVDAWLSATSGTRL